MLAVVDALIEWAHSPAVRIVVLGVLFVGMLVVGPLAHELSHALVATLLGCRVVGIGMGYCDYERPRETWKIRVIGIAPTVFALAAAVPVWYLDLWVWTPTSALVLGMWLIWGFSISPKDLSPAAGKRAEPTAEQRR